MEGEFVINADFSKNAVIMVLMLVDTGGNQTQVHEVLKLVIELLPASTVNNNQLALEKESFLANQPDLLQQFGTDMLPVMIQVISVI